MSYRIGDRTYVQGVQPRSYASSLSRTATSPAHMFTLPPRSTVKQVTIIGVKSNAGGTARISIGSSGGSGKEFLADFNVKTNGDVSYPSSFGATVGANDLNPIIVTAQYAEDGTASNTGGPWTIIFDLL